MWKQFFRFFYFIILKIWSCSESFEQDFKVKSNVYKTNNIIKYFETELYWFVAIWIYLLVWVRIQKIDVYDFRYILSS